MSRYATNPEALPAELVRACSDQETAETWTCDACGDSACYLTRDPWIDQDGRRLCGPCARPGPEREEKSPPEEPPTLAGICDVCGTEDPAVYTVETTESALKWSAKAEYLTLCETCFENGADR